MLLSKLKGIENGIALTKDIKTKDQKVYYLDNRGYSCEYDPDYKTPAKVYNPEGKLIFTFPDGMCPNENQIKEKIRENMVWRGIKH